jgi:hypothetical protein
MKMVKKSIIALAVVALMVTVVHAAENPIKRDGDWPWTYKSINLCTMPVYMDVGHYVQLEKCHERKIHLKQVDCTSLKDLDGGDFPCYTDCETFKARANFAAIFGASLSKEGGILDKTRLYWKDDIHQIAGTGGWEELTICMDAWKAQIWKAAKPHDKLKVGELTINVKPPDGP